MTKPDEPSTVVVDVIPPSCPKCGSTERSENYNKTRTRAIRGTLPDGRIYTHVTHRRTRCECGQIRVERMYENRPVGKRSAKRTKSPKKSKPDPDTAAKTEDSSAQSREQPVAVPVEHEA